MRRSGPTRARPVARMRCSPEAVRGMSVLPVWRPERDQVVSPWRIMKTRGVVMFSFLFFSFLCLLGCLFF